MRRLCICVALLLSPLCAAQVTGTFSLDNSVFAVGDPVFLNLTISNEGDEPEQIVTADPYSFCSGYKIKISRNGSPRISCSQNWGGSCASGGITVGPHARRTERILLNYPDNSRGDMNPPIRLPGAYTVDAVRTISYGPPGVISNVFENPETTEVHQVFDIDVDGTRHVDSSKYAAFINQLASPDEQIRREAARTLATLAPPSLEPLLLTFATSKDYVLQESAPLALSNLASNASLAALAEMLTRTQPGTYESMSSAEYLGRTHDPKWFPVLLAFADRHAPIYLPYAAQSGGEAAIPALLARLRSTEPGVRTSAIYALGSTGSRAAVPVLISLLNVAIPSSENSSSDDAVTANAALEQLTHEYIDRSSPGPWVEQARQRWQQWWRAAGQNAKTYLPGECVADTELP